MRGGSQTGKATFGMTFGLARGGGVDERRDETCGGGEAAVGELSVGRLGGSVESSGHDGTLDTSLGVYVHWPYCARICPYCDFNVHRARDYDAGMVEVILADLAQQRELTGARRVESLHFGGGTPSLMVPGDVARVVDTVDRLWGLDGEVGLEANPKTGVDAKALRDAGVNRLSFGVQSFHDPALGMLGRDHSGAEAARAVGDALSVIGDVSVDLIFGWAGQTAALWATDLDRALGLGVPHVSAYQLTVEPGTAFARAEARGRGMAVDGDMSAELYDLAEARLTAEGFEHYEVSNYALDPGKGGKRSVHNSRYWRGGDYVGAGPGAHGRITMEGERFATETPRRPADYRAGPQPTMEALSVEDVRLERLLMGLRLREGVRLSEVEPVELSGLDGLVEVEGGRLRATPDGWRVLDRVIAELLR